MGTRSPPALRSLIGIVLIWPSVFTQSFSARLQTAHSDSLSAGLFGVSFHLEGRPHVVKRNIQNCSRSFENYCLNEGQCVYLLDFNEHHCICEIGFSGSRCASLDMEPKQSGDHTFLTLFCVGLVIIGLILILALYFCCRWCKKKRCQQERLSYKGVQQL